MKNRYINYFCGDKVVERVGNKLYISKIIDMDPENAYCITDSFLEYDARTGMGAGSDLRIYRSIRQFKATDHRVIDGQDARN